MRFSYIEPRAKYLVSKLSKIWIFYIFLSLLLVGGLVGFMHHAINNTQNDASSLTIQERLYRHEISRLQMKTDEALQLIKEAKKRLNYNDDVRDVLQGLLNIVPDSITINSIEIDQQSVVISGKAPSKEAFYFLLQNKLNPMFDYSSVEFFPLSDGWFNFVSSNSSNSLLISNP
ncbi:hypothetical protein KVC60_02630 [Helicobacter pylori]|uniref:Uncharacterized protein n=1 Tax=Helicobacter pylori Aklavik86 TaxID=1055532 RepID=K7Z0J3_HELPX|nr:hypothetical protein [Helicobacter pylori]AFX89530.1 hypothetical protein HPAKL86_02590 [Helicobacter pylori Aklavik86]WQS07741.1 hypothetical protein KVE43_05375 [Helicobacter pylori]WQS14770.1 hypothetical protein KVD76_02650 [Helicobacter pylori]WQS21202.1 hypothetical protein KVC60_02630 [Helicobacter pylori]WQS24502.1 hypothetical protein KVD61_02660 [Helicobacter pylori]